MKAFLFHALLILIPSTFVWSFLLIAKWCHFKTYLLTNVGLCMLCVASISYLIRNDSDGWGLIILGIPILYGFFTLSILTAFFIRAKLL
jgi:hypothetical protein